MFLEIKSGKSYMNKPVKPTRILEYKSATFGVYFKKKTFREMYSKWNVKLKV